MAVVRPGEFIYFVCKGDNGKVKVKGITLEVLSDGTLVAGVDPAVVKGVPNAILFEKSGSKSVGLIKIPAESVSTVVPAGWGNQAGGVAPKLAAAKVAWEKMSGEALNSSETEQLGQQTNPSGPSRKSRLEEDLLQMSQELWDVSEEEGESSSDGGMDRRRRGGKHLAPGASGSSAERPKSREGKNSGKEADFQKLMLKSLSSGASPSDMVPLMMMQMMMQQQSDKKSRRRGRDRSPGSSDSDSSGDDELGKDPGMKSVATLHRLHRRVKHHPRDIIRNFEKELTEELGVVPGQFGPPETG